MTLRLALSSGALYPRTATEFAPQRAAELGFSDVELMLQTPGEYAPGFLRSVRASADAAGVTIHSLHAFQSLHPFFTGYERRTSEALDLFRLAIAGAGICGAHVLVWHGMSRAEASTPDAWDRFIDVMSLLADECAAGGVSLAIENVSWCVVSDVRDVLRLNGALDTMPRDASIGYVFDTFQALERGANPFMLLAAMKDRLLNVHVSDGIGGDASLRHLLPGDGELPWPALIKAISGSGYSGPMMIEAPIAGEDDVARVRGVLSGLLAAETSADPCSEPLPDGVRAGIALFNAGEYYEAHEVIEHEWHAERRPIRLLYQGILQIGVGLHHVRGGNHRGAELLLADGIAKISHFLPACQGVRTDRLITGAQNCLGQVVDLGSDRIGEFDWSRVPVIAIDQ